MGLWLDRREALKNDPAAGRTHALIVGTSRYKWLPKRGQTAPDPNRNTLGLTEVDISATSALLFATWLRDSFQNPEAPLATIHLCVNPSDEEKQQIPGMKDLGSHCIGTKRATIMEHLQAWQTACRANPKGIAILYASGHGIQMPGSKEEALILLEDFAEDPQIFTYSIDIGANRRAMNGETMPQTQLYFADACRLPANTKLQGLGNGACLPWDSSIPDERSAPIYYSALSGLEALGVKQKGTFFIQALIDCLNGLALAGPDKKSSLTLEREKWHVSVQGLASRLDQRVKELAGAKAKELQDKGITQGLEELEKQGVMVGGESRQSVFHALPLPPKVRVILEIDPEDQAAETQAELHLPTRERQIGTRNCRPKPCQFDVDAGLYSLDLLAKQKEVRGIVLNAEPQETVFRRIL